VKEVISRARIKQAKERLNKVEEELGDKCKTANFFTIRFETELNKVAKRFSISPEVLWRKYSGLNVSRKIVERKDSVIKKLWMKIKIVESKTPFSEWWLAWRHKGTKKLGWRAIKLPQNYCYVRIPIYRERMNWARGRCRLIQDEGNKVFYKQLYKRWCGGKKAVIDKLPTMGSFWEQEKKLLEQRDIEITRKKRERLVTYMNELMIRRIFKTLEEKGEKNGFTKFTKVGNPYTEKPTFEEEWMCPEGAACPCGFYKGCKILKSVLK